MDKILEWLMGLDITTALTTLGGLATAIGTIIVSHNSVKKSNFEHNDKIMIELENVQNSLQVVTLETVRTELNQAIDHNYGDEIISHLYSRYKMLGGNSYMTQKVKDYFENRVEEWEK
ncbi:hypothetical protein WOSG25_410020 [Weissella oryzae SG25]|uniref:Uncharacterized protein n=1 Tax=Weissella oryzae (strain DSM 25784 / JCM 18191 / LMG 30913 / SG25) TaxID=1329250 RepID=A0A069CXL8_WEIOS|nr:hypothetical protein [Weissella oryzae]GAK32112.1 hypothetical protein WOSG25_410020 [Weissella oryzae SG25]